MLSRICLFLLLLPSAFSALAQESPATPALIEVIEVFVMTLRQQYLLREPARSFLSPEAAADAYRQSALAEWSADEADRQYLLYRALDLAEPGLDIRALYVDYLSQQLGGYYDPDDEAITVIKPEGAPGTDLSYGQHGTYVHEFVHALQDQHFDLDEFMASNNSEGSLDRWLALSALVEGDATYTVTTFMFMLLESGDESVPRQPASADDLPLAPPPDLPGILLKEIDFMYWTGSAFVREVVDRHGWLGIKLAFREDPPLTTEQIMHPQRYLSGEGPKPVNMPDHGSLIGEDWRLGYDGPVGEFLLLAHLETQLRAPHSERYAKGWGGDQLRIYVAPSGQDMMWIWAQTWDSVNDADQFADGYAYFLDKRYFGRYQPERADEHCWVNDDGTHCFARVSETETRISMAADRETALALLQMDG